MNAPLKNLTIVILGVLLAVAVVGGAAAATAGGSAQTRPAPASQTGGDATLRTINVTGDGSASAPPDVAQIQLGVETINPDATQAIDENTTRMTAVMAVLRQMQIEDKDIQTTNYNMWLEQVLDKNGQPTGETRYHVVNQVQVSLRDLTKTGDLLQQALQAGANNAGGISFRVADQTGLEREARDRALADAQAKAEQLAAGLGAKLGPVRQVTESTGVIPPGPSPLAAERAIGGAGPVPVSGGEFSVTVQVQVAFDIAE